MAREAKNAQVGNVSHKFISGMTRGAMPFRDIGGKGIPQYHFQEKLGSEPCFRTLDGRPMRRPFPLVLVTVISWILFLQSAFATTFYIAANGSDSNNGTSKTSPWLHAPGMPGAGGKPASYSPQPGDNFVFRGCDTWTFSSSWRIPSSGSGGGPITYGGEDQSWYNASVCPSSWSRPIFSGGGAYFGTAGPTNFVEMGSHAYLTIDNIEFTGMYVTGAGNGFYIDLATATNFVISNNYFHGAAVPNPGGLTSGGASGAIWGQGLPSGNNGKVFLNVIDFGDSTLGAQSVLDGINVSNTEVYENYLANMDTCMVGALWVIHDNVFYNCGVPAQGNGLHANQVESNGDGGAGGGLYYNNVFVSPDIAETNGSPILLQIAPQPGSTTYAFNNVFEDSTNGRPPISCSHGSNSAAGTCIVFNNTVECGRDSGPTQSCGEAGDGGSLSNGIIEGNYNHFITSQSPSKVMVVMNAGKATMTPNPNLVETLSQANNEGYTMSTGFAPSAGGSTIGAGGSATTYTSLCNTIGATFGASYGQACQSDTTLGVTYDTANHTVRYPARSPHQRPTSGNWDAGAFFFGSGGINPPTGLAASVQ